MQKLAECVNLKETIDTLPDSCYIGQYTYNGRPLTVSVRNSNVEHIGYNLFGAWQRAGQFDYVFDFIERWYLDNDLKFNTEARNAGNRSISFIRGNEAQMRSCTNDTTVNIEVQCFSDNRYEISWIRGDNKVCEIVFPANYELITGSTMVENESSLQERLCAYSHQPKDSIDMSPSKDELQPGIYNPELMMLDRGHPRTDLVGCRLFYNIDSDSIPHLTYSPYHPIESAANLLCSDMIPTEFTANVKLMKYNFTKELFSLPLYDFIGYFINEGCTPYFGLINYDENDRVVVCIIEMHNFKLAYEHLMKIKIDLSQMSELKGVAEITLTSYIPTTNYKPNDTY